MSAAPPRIIWVGPTLYWCPGEVKVGERIRVLDATVVVQTVTPDPESGGVLFTAEAVEA